MEKTEKAKQYDRERAIFLYATIQVAEMLKDGKTLEEISNSSKDKLTRMGYYIDINGFLYDNEGNVI